MGVRTVVRSAVAGNLSRQTLAAMGSLIAIAVERAQCGGDTGPFARQRAKANGCARPFSIPLPTSFELTDFDQGLDYQPASPTSGLSPGTAKN